MNPPSDTQAGSKFTACPSAGLPARSVSSSLPLSPIDNAEGDGEPTTTSSTSASAELARVLGGNPTGEMSEANEELEPVETRDARRAPTPSDPTTAEVENHKLEGHAVFRSWCRHCVRGRCREAAHSSVECARRFPTNSQLGLLLL